MNDQHPHRDDSDASLDPGLEEIRAIKRDIAAQFDNDVGKLIAHLRELQTKYADRLVSPPTTPKQPHQRKSA